MITTDQGREFSNNLNVEVMLEFNIEHRLTTPYHPQANGLDERFNQTVKKVNLSQSLPRKTVAVGI